MCAKFKRAKGFRQCRNSCDVLNTCVYQNNCCTRFVFSFFFRLTILQGATASNVYFTESEEQKGKS